MNRKIAAFSVIIALLIAVTCVIGGAALAQEKKEYVNIGYGPQQDPELREIVIKIQFKLQELGYYDEGEVIQEGVVDDATVKAVSRFCADNQMNPDIIYITPGIQSRLLEGNPAHRPTKAPETPSPTPFVEETPAPFEPVRPGYSAHSVDEVQQQLEMKGYFKDSTGAHTPGLLDPETEKAIDRFCQLAGIRYDSSQGLTEGIYNRIMSENAPTYAPPTPTPYNTIGYGTPDDEATREEIKKIQQRLKEKGYFRDCGDPAEWGTYEEHTSEAVYRFCEIHGLSNPDQTGGMDKTFYDKLMSDEALDNPVDRKDYVRGDQGDDIRTLQDRLWALSYYRDKESNRTGEYDDAMNEVLVRFAEVNQVPYDEETLTVSLQDTILNESAKANPEDPVVKEGFDDWLKKHWMYIAGGIVILAGLTFLVIHVFSSGKGDSGSTSSAGSGYVGSSPSGGSGRPLNLEVCYQGSSKPVTVNMDKPLRIGRNERTLPLDPRDSDISRQHCQMSFRGDALILRDYSTNGTEVNHQSYHNCECVIHSGDLVKIGNHEITVRF